MFIWEDGKRDGEVLKWVLEVVGESGKGGGAKEFRVEVRVLPALIPRFSSHYSFSTSCPASWDVFD